MVSVQNSAMDTQINKERLQSRVENLANHITGNTQKKKLQWPIPAREACDFTNN